jgi:AcrR family transcriptional regulator
LSSFFADRPTRADARRNSELILVATAELLADEPGASLEHVAAHAGVSRATLYHHFAGRDALLDALTERSIAEVKAAIESARPRDGSPAAAMDRVLRAAWEVIGRYRGLVIVNPRRLDRAELRARLEPALGPVRALIIRGQRGGDFDPELPADWWIGVITDVIHAASRQVSAGAMDPAEAERALLRTAGAALAAHRHRPTAPGRRARISRGGGP